MTASESKFRMHLKKLFNDPKIYIKKIADKKQLGHGGNTGLPDYLVISKGKVVWFEVKQVLNSKYNIQTFNLNIISNNQWIEFTKMFNAGAKIYVAIYLNKSLYIVNYDRLAIAKMLAGQNSIHSKTLLEWGNKDGINY